MTTIPAYTHEVIVRDYETDLNSRWKPSSFFRLIQYSGSSHANLAGYDFYDLMATGRAWVLYRIRMRMLRYPAIKDRLIMHTWINGYQQKLLYLRGFKVEDEQGNLVADAISASLLIDLKNRQILKPSSIPEHKVFDIPDPTPHEPLEKIDAPQDMPECYQIKATYSQLDMVGHVNNANYVDWVCDCFEPDFHRKHQMESIQINFLQEIRPDEQISMRMAPESGKTATWLVSGENLSRPMRAFDARVSWVPRP